MHRATEFGHVRMQSAMANSLFCNVGGGNTHGLLPTNEHVKLGANGNGVCDLRDSASRDIGHVFASISCDIHELLFRVFFAYKDVLLRFHN